MDNPIFILCLAPAVYSAVLFYFGFYIGRYGAPIKIVRNNDNAKNNQF